MSWLTALALFATQPALAQNDDVSVEADVRIDLDDAPRGFGVGVVLGEPTGLTLAVRPNLHHAFQSHLSWSLVHDRVRVSADYLGSLAVFHAEGAPLDFPLYLGIGGVFGAGETPPWNEDQNPWLGARVPFGVSMLPHRVPVEVFAEIAPVLYLLPETSPGVEGAIGVRGYF